jgi:hypothetical protein
MPVTLNKRKPFNKVQKQNIERKALDARPKRKALDEVMEIKRSEWDAMQESISKVQKFMQDLVEGNLEIEIIDDEKEPKAEPKAEKELELEMEEGEMQIPEEGEMEMPEEGEEPEEKAEDADLNETLKDPAKRKAVMEFLKISDEKEVVKAKDEKPKRELKKKTLQKSQDAGIPDFTSRFDQQPVEQKANDSSLEEDMSQKFINRFE